jgi:hypothetical protein
MFAFRRLLHENQVVKISQEHTLDISISSMKLGGSLIDLIHCRHSRVLQQILQSSGHGLNSLYKSVFVHSDSDPVVHIRFLARHCLNIGSVAINGLSESVNVKVSHIDEESVHYHWVIDIREGTFLH